MADPVYYRVLGFRLSNGPTVALTYSKPTSEVGAGALLMTATFSEALVAAPNIAIDRPGSGNDVGATTMTATGDSKVWTFVYDVAATNGTTILDGLTSVDITGGLTADGLTNQTASNRTFTVDATPPACLAISTITAAPACVSHGQVVSPVTMSVTNTGGSTANITSVGLTFQ
ncbi:MAG: hypothetical protein FD129_3411, partial [bacterium]